MGEFENVAEREKTMKPPLMKLSIPVAESGFYAGFSKNVAVSAKVLVGMLVVWAVAFPDDAAATLGMLNKLILAKDAPLADVVAEQCSLKKTCRTKKNTYGIHFPPHWKHQLPQKLMSLIEVAMLQ